MQNVKIALILGTLILFSGCAPKIVSIKSPINSLETKKCFTLPSKEILSKSPIYKQKLYQLTQNSLQKYKINFIYANEGDCNNYLLTDWVITTSKEMVTSKGTTYTNSYGNLYSNAYSSTSTYSGNSYSYTTPDVTYEDVSYKGIYSLEVGQIKDNDLLKVWSGTQSGRVSGSSLQDAQKITNDIQPYVDDMVKQMLIENHLLARSLK